MLITFDGTDFVDSTKTTFRKFSLTKENFVLLGIFAGISISKYMSMDFNIHHKVSGRNTDKATGLGIGISYYY